jgi:hypothetical protein
MIEEVDKMTESLAPDNLLGIANGATSVGVTVEACWGVMIKENEEVIPTEDNICHEEQTSVLTHG